jgi:hypothetical protein
MSSKLVDYCTANGLSCASYDTNEAVLEAVSALEGYNLCRDLAVRPTSFPSAR